MVIDRKTSQMWAGLLAVCALLLSGCSTPSEQQMTSQSQTLADTVSIRDTEAIDAFIAEQMEALNIPGLSLAVIRKGRIDYVQAYGAANRENGKPVTTSTLFETASLSKPAFAYFTMIQVDKGVITLDDPLSNFLQHPDISDSRANMITARMILSHQSGFPNWRWENKDGLLDIKFNPGTEFSYSGEGFEYLAMVLAHELGLSLGDLPDRIAEDLTDPLGIEHAYWAWTDALSEKVATGYSNNTPKDPWKIDTLIASASLHTSAEDYARIIVAMLDGRTLSEGSYQEMLSNQVLLEDSDDFRLDFGLEAWGLGVAFKKTPQGTVITHGGVNEAFTAWFTVLKESKTGYVFLTNSESGPELNKILEPWLLTHLQR